MLTILTESASSLGYTEQEERKIKNKKKKDFLK